MVSWFIFWFFQTDFIADFKSIHFILINFHRQGDDSNNCVPLYFIQRGLECILLLLQLLQGILLLLETTTLLTASFLSNLDCLNTSDFTLDMPLCLRIFVSNSTVSFICAITCLFSSLGGHHWGPFGNKKSIKKMLLPCKNQNSSKIVIKWFTMESLC